MGLKDAQSFISSRSSELFHSPAIEDEAFHRIKKYPDAMSDNLHNALICIPRKLAYVIHKNPSSVSPAIEAFYLRDPISLRHLQKEKASELYFPPEDLVIISVRFTKVGYAQIKSQEFSPPAVWASKYGAPAEQSSLQQVSQVDTGIKITCGYEMLLADNHFQDNRIVREIKLLLEDLENGEDIIPDDEVISKWSQVHDDEKWLDIDFNAFDRELSGQAKGSQAKSGFGDEAAQESLRKVVERFEAFLKDDSAGAEGVADIDDMDFDDDEDTDEESGKIGDEISSADERKNLEAKRAAPSEGPYSGRLRGPRIQELGSDDEEVPDKENEADEEEAEEIMKEMQQIEEELQAHGMLDLNTDAGGPATSKARSESLESRDKGKGPRSTSTDNDRIRLAGQLLESFKAQAGAPGPAGNLMGMLGAQMPRDEELPKT